LEKTGRLTTLFKSNGGSKIMKSKLVLILCLLVAFVMGGLSPISAVAATQKRRVVYVKHRSKKHQAAIIGGSAAGGAAIGALAGGGKGALIGAGVGAAGGAIYNQKTKNKVVTQ
jgi:uncharacterized protein YcfJ